MEPQLLAQLKVLLASVATAALTITPVPVQQSVQAITNNNSTAPNVGSNGNSRNWSGYVSNNGTYTSVTGTWTVPQVTTTDHTATDATWIGIGGVSSSDLIQSGTQNVVTPAGQVTTTAFYEILPDPSTPITSLTVKPGDSVTATITEQGTGQWSISFKDNNTGQSYQTSVTYNSSVSSAEWIEEAPSNGVSVLPLDNFGTLPFSNGSTTLNGSQVSISGSNAHAVTMLNNQGQALATPSSLESDGASFSVSRSSAVSNAPIPNFDQNPGSWRRRGWGINPWSRPTTTPTESISPEPNSQPTSVHVFRFGRHFSHRFFRRNQ